jgi:hypothetical protein
LLRREGAREMKTLQIELPPEVSKKRRGFFWLSNSMNLDALVLGNPLSWLVTQSVLFIELLGKYGVLVIAYLPEELREEVNR